MRHFRKWKILEPESDSNPANFVALLLFLIQGQHM